MVARCHQQHTEHPSKQMLLPFYVTSSCRNFNYILEQHTESRDQSNQCAAEINDKLPQAFPLHSFGLHVLPQAFSS